jgi:hypothetical protein
MEEFMKKLALRIVPVVLVLCYCGPSWAELIKIGFVAQIDNVSDIDNLLQNKVHAGDSVTGFYILDSATPNSNTDNQGTYLYASAPYGISARVGSLIFQTDPTNVDFRINVLNNYYEQGDWLKLFSYNNVRIADNIKVNFIGWQLNDYYGNALTNTNLPLTPPTILQWNNDQILSIRGGIFETSPDCDDPTFIINSHVISAYAIPEPVTLATMGVGGLLMSRRKNNAVSKL